MLMLFPAQQMAAEEEEHPLIFQTLHQICALTPRPQHRQFISNGPTTRTTKTSSMCKERLPEAVRGLFRFSLKDQTLSHTQIHLLFPALSTTTEFRHVVRVTDVPRTLIFTM